MVYIKKWPQFQAQCLDLYNNNPEKTRYLIKATPSQTWLVLKVTDDQKCLKFRTRSSIILNRFESFTRDLTASMAGKPLPSAIVATESLATDSHTAKLDSAEQKVPAASGTTQSGGSSSKKKKKKGKK